MGLREEILDALERLEKRTGQKAHRVRDIITEVHSRGVAASAVTIRTYVTSVMCADAPVHHANHTDDLRRVDRGWYQRIESASAVPNPLSPSVLEATPSDQSTTGNQSQEALWEGTIQAGIVAALVHEGWSIMSVASTQKRAQGTDIVGAREDELLHIEVKGFPSTSYARGERQGQPKPTHPATQARQWFAGALLKAAMLRGDHPGDRVALGLPDVETYRNLVQRTSSVLSRSEIELIWVDRQGRVMLPESMKKGER